MNRQAQEGRKGCRARGLEQRRDIEQPADRCRGNLVGEMNEIADEPPWSRERNGNVLSARASMHLEKDESRPAARSRRQGTLKSKAGPRQPERSWSRSDQRGGAYRKMPEAKR